MFGLYFLHAWTFVYGVIQFYLLDGIKLYLNWSFNIIKTPLSPTVSFSLVEIYTSNIGIIYIFVLRESTISYN